MRVPDQRTLARSLTSLLLTGSCLTLCAALAASAEPDSGARQVDYVRDVQPILSDNCYSCHGPDSKHRQASLRLDTRKGALRNRSGWAAVVPGDPDESEMILRINAEDIDDRMPPLESHLSLSEDERALLYRWIEEGAKWSEHWAFTPPKAPNPPEVSDEGWPRNAIDHFVMARLDREGLSPTRQAAPEMLLRRLSLDLTGVPPTPAELQAFLASEEAGRWEREVTRLLASPRYGERMAWPWLDAARYADSNGYQGDRDRSMWPWRDWVVRAFNENLPFDDFTVWQLAGDLLDEPTQEQLLATGFLRNHMINGEGGRIAEENRVEYVFDQLETVGTVWLGMTMNCCRCHDHKFDPLSQRNYFELFDFFNQTPVTGEGGDPQTPPVLEVPNEAQALRLSDLDRRIRDRQDALDRRALELEAGRAEWEDEARRRLESDPWSALRPTQASASGQDLDILLDDSVLASGANPKNDTYRIELPVEPGVYRAIRLEVLRHPTMTEGGMARSNSGNFVLTSFEVRVRTQGTPGEALALRGARATIAGDGFPVAGALEESSESGWAVWRGEPITSDHEALFQFDEALELGVGDSLLVILRHDSIHEHHNMGRFRFSITSDGCAELGQDRVLYSRLLRTPHSERTQEQVSILEAAMQARDPQHTELRELHRASIEVRADLRQGLPRVMIMADQEERRATYILGKGLYDRRGEVVQAGLPAILPELPVEGEANRLGLARWLVTPENPLTARVIVNRLWAQVFGAGLVDTPENFGSQGARPSHPELLDWLATEFITSGWDIKHMMRLMVTSATYGQSSDVSAAHHERDPANVLFARGARYRMPAWMLRDQALAISGLLVDDPGGKGVHPYQPDGIWREYTFDVLSYPDGEGDALYRRSLYTFWRRIVAPTMFFDSATRQSCSVEERRTNTPLHSLAVLNDVTYVEAARVLSQRLLLSEGIDDEERLRLGFERVLVRQPVAAEQQLLADTLSRLRVQYAEDPHAAEALIAVGASKRDASIESLEHAAWTCVILALLNLDETLTRE